MKVFLFIISFVLFVNCSNNKSELVKAIKNKKEDIEKKNNNKILSVYQFSKNTKIDSTINNLENFKNFRKSIESIFILNFNGIDTFLDDAVGQCNELLESNLPSKINSPQFLSRLKVIKTKILICKYNSKFNQDSLLQKSIYDLNYYYNAFLKMTENLILSDDLNEDRISNFNSNSKIRFE